MKALGRWRRLSLHAWVLTAGATPSAAWANPDDCPIIDEAYVSSANKLFFTGPGPADRTTVVYAVGGVGQPNAMLWEMPGSGFPHFLSDDGDYLVKCREQPTQGRKIDEAPLSIYKRGKLVTAVRLNHMILSPKHIRPIRRGLYGWGHCKGFVSLHRFAVETVEKRRLEYDAMTGALVAVSETPRAIPGTNARPPK